MESPQQQRLVFGSHILHSRFVKSGNLDNNITDCADSLTYVLDPAKIAITVPDADHIDEAIKWIKENDVLNPLDYEEFQRIVDTFTELKNNKN